MKPIFLTAALPAALLGGCAGADAPERPNILFIYADDLGIGDLSCYGGVIPTPNLDRLAGEGQRFTNAYATSSVSTPSRFGLLTGIYPWRQGNTGIRPGNSELIIDTACYTLADALHGVGYGTGAVGKWHLGLGPAGGTDFNVEIRPDARDIGFDYEYVIPATVDRVPCVFVENGRVVGLDPADPITVSYGRKVGDWPTGRENPELVRMHPSPNHGHDNTIVNGIPRIGFMTGGRAALWIDEGIADTIALKASRFIADHADRPFFLYMGTNDVHVPRVPHPRFEGKSGHGSRGDVILQLDWTVGQVLRTLDSLGIADRTLVVFTSDNGPVIDDGYADGAVELLGDHTPMGSYRGGKYSLFEAGTRIPMMVRWPARVKPGVQEALFSQIDIYRSLAALTGAELPEGAAPDSQNRLPELLGERHEDRAYVVQQNVNNALSILSEGWKYLEPSNGARYNALVDIELGNSPEPQLYDIVSDPGERIDLAGENPERVECLSRWLAEIRAKSDAQR
ncbi:MAG: arylsulfatase [Alistipes sp.]|nr:arylsulfatase [Alistipes sp.]